MIAAKRPPMHMQWYFVQVSLYDISKMVTMRHSFWLLPIFYLISIQDQWLTGIVGFKSRLSPSSCLLFVSGKSTRVILSSYHPRWSALWAFGWPGFTFPRNQVLFRRSFSIEPQSRSQRAKRGKESRKIFSWETQLLERCRASSWWGWSPWGWWTARRFSPRMTMQRWQKRKMPLKATRRWWQKHLTCQEETRDRF